MMNIWKTLFIGLVSTSLVIGGGVKFYNSDWLINKTMKVKTITDENVGKRVKWDYTNKYEDGKLKIAIQLKNIDPKMLELTKKYLREDDFIAKIVLLDKDRFAIKEAPIKAEQVIDSITNENEYNAQVVVQINKKEVRKIDDVSFVFRTILDKTYKEYLKEIWR